MKKTILLACLASSVSTAILAEESSDFEAYLGGARYLWDNDRNLDDANSLEGGVELPVGEALSLEAWLSDFDADIENSSSELDGNRYSLGALYHLAEGDTRPFVSLGGAHLEFENEAGSSFDESIVYLGGGVKKYFDNNIILRAELLAMNSIDNEWTDLGARLAIGYAFGRDVSKPAIIAEPASVKVPVKTTVKAEKPMAKPVEVAKPEVKPVVIAEPVDSDQDGVVDTLDKCEATNPAFKVDESGCPVMLTETVSIAMNVKFKSNSPHVSEDNFSEIKKVADFMKQFDQTKVVVEGHSDDSGRAAYNKTLSQKRADAVRMTLIDTFKLPAERISAVGFGEENPIADNASAEGRAKNRRVVAVVQSTIEKAETK